MIRSFKCDVFVNADIYIPQKTNMEPKRNERFGKVFPFPISGSVLVFGVQPITRYTAIYINYRAPCIFGFRSNDISNSNVFTIVGISYWDLK